MNRAEYQGYRHNYRNLRREARIESRFRGLSPAMDLFLATFTRRERQALTAEKARDEAVTLRKLANEAGSGPYMGGRAYSHAAAFRRDSIARAQQLDRLANELDTLKAQA